MTSWQDNTIEWESLRRYAAQFPDTGNVITWLYAIGVVPNDVKTMPEPNVKTEIDPKSIKCGYLAASAFQMQRWGTITPTEFLDAIELELAGSAKNSVATEAKDPSKPKDDKPSIVQTARLIDTPELDGFLAEALMPMVDDDIAWALNEDT